MFYESCTTINSDLSIDEIDKRFIELHKQLSEIKSRLDLIPPNKFTQMMIRVDRYFKLKDLLKYDYNMSVSTNASLKMYEMLSTGPIAARKLDHISAFCNAEFPGAFISAINHYSRNRSIPLRWAASSFWPADEYSTTSIFGDTYGLYRNYKDRWLMGPKPDGSYISGDVCRSDVIIKLSEEAKKSLGGEINLYTSDAGIDVHEDYNNQENLTCAINYGQILCGLMSLSPGGTLVTKQYTFFNKFNRALIYKLSGMFEELYIAKPLTSRPVNSEIYLIGIGFSGIDKIILDEMLKISDDIKKYSFDELAPRLSSPPPEFDNNTLRIANKLYREQQIPTILEAVKAYKTQVFPKMDNEAIKGWIKNTKISKIKPEEQLVTLK